MVWHFLDILVASRAGCPSFLAGRARACPFAGLWPRVGGVGRLCVTQLCVSGSHCRGPGHTGTLQRQWFCGSMDLDLDFWGYLLLKDLGSGWEELPEEA